MYNQKTLLGVSGILIGLLVFVGFFFLETRAPEKDVREERFIVAREAETGEVIKRLYGEGFVKNEFIFKLLYRGEIEEGGYLLSRAMSAFEISSRLKETPYMKWVVIPEGLRKEQIAQTLKDELGWSREQVHAFISKDTETLAQIPEGVFFPDTYLIPRDESTQEVAQRLFDRFNENFASSSQEAFRQNIRWPTVVSMASLVEREAAGEEDMSLVAGIIWNRLLRGQRLEIDATVQYARDTHENYSFDNICEEEEPWQCRNWVSTYTGEGSAEHGWWRPIQKEDKALTPFNTYREKGLPSRPIANPGLSAIEAVLFPEKTDCLFYLHESDGTIHCSETLQEHEKAIDTYLR